MYEHVQKSPLHVLLYLPAAFSFVVAWQIRNDLAPSLIVLFVAFVLIVLALSFQKLKVSDEEDYLRIQYGPLNLFGTRIFYDEITDVEPGKSSLIDGWGIHFIPFRGWTFNLWGFECVKIKKGKKTIRVGTDDSKNLAEFVNGRLQANQDIKGE